MIGNASNSGSSSSEFLFLAIMSPAGSQQKRSYAQPTGVWPKASPSYNDTPGWRKVIQQAKQGLTLKRISIRQKLGQSRKNDSVMELECGRCGRCVKFRNRVHLCEAAAMRLVAEKISIPVPKVYSVHLSTMAVHTSL